MAISHIDMNKCTGCGMCENYCPVDVIRFNRETRQPEIKFVEDCMLCLLCENRCPVEAITVTKEKKENVFLAWG